MKWFPLQTWSDLKVDAKKKAGVINDNLRRTGGGPPPEDIMTDVQKRIVGLLGQVSVEGIESAVEVGINNDEQAETSIPEYEIVYNIDDDSDEHLELVEEPKKKRKLANNEDTQSGSNKKVRKSRVQQSEALLEIEERKTSALENISLALGRIADAIWAFTKI
uniref:Uncharacterized protein n=1 Tax=Timema cristinae TaxID=61476 RepID=A0A7R9HDK0_TIMCR|nr:unnamed protein product [Timema cristinae]